MPSAKLMPLESLFRQWFLTQWSEGDGDSRRSYRIVFQRPLASFPVRTASAHAFLEEKQLYRRAGLRTPGENATKDMLGSSLWLHELLRLILKASSVKDHSGQDASDDMENKHGRSLIWIPTSSASTITNLPDDITSHDAFGTVPTSCIPSGWDDNDDEGGDNALPSLDDLDSILQAIERQLANNTTRKMCIVFESLSPILVRHGFARTMHFLQKILPCMMILPVQHDSMTPQQHGFLEDVCQALLCLRQGDMTMVRQGVRESGNIVRAVLPFRIESRIWGYELVQAGSQSDKDDNKGNSSHAASAPAVSARTSGRVDGNDNRSQVSSRRGANSKSKKKKISLKLEEDAEDDIHHGNAGSKEQSNPSAPVVVKPRIFMQDDDPEFDDFDEEDPDDDLDL